MPRPVLHVELVATLHPQHTPEGVATCTYIPCVIREVLSFLFPHLEDPSALIWQT